MKISYLIKILILTILIQGCIPTKRISFDNDKVENFKNWKKNSVKEFLSGNWIRIGRFDGNNIIEDTLSTYTSFNNRDDKKYIITEIINPSGLYHLVNDSIAKQNEIPSVDFDFHFGWADLTENECTPPDFKSCGMNLTCFYTDRLIFINEKPVRELSGFSGTKRVKNPIHYLNKNVILIEDVAYVKSEKWQEYVANNAYNLWLR